MKLMMRRSVTAYRDAPGGSVANRPVMPGEMIWQAHNSPNFFLSCPHFSGSIPICWGNKQVMSTGPRACERCAEPVSCLVRITSCGSHEVCADRDVELTVLMPCLDEAETVATCVTKALAFLNDHYSDC